MWIYLCIIVFILVFPYLRSIEGFSKDDPFTLGQIQKGILNKYDKDIENILAQSSRLDELQKQIDELGDQTSEFISVSQDNNPTNNYSSPII